MNLIVNLFRAAVFVFTATFACGTFAAKPAAPPPKPAARVGEPIEFDQLGQYLGREVVIHTRHGTRRMGIVINANSTAVMLKLGATEGGIDLDIPRHTVRRIELITDMETAVGEARAKKK